MVMWVPETDAVRGTRVTVVLLSFFKLLFILFCNYTWSAGRLVNLFVPFFPLTSIWCLFIQSFRDSSMYTEKHTALLFLSLSLSFFLFLFFLAVHIKGMIFLYCFTIFCFFPLHLSLKGFHASTCRNTSSWYSHLIFYGLVMPPCI